MTRGSKFTGNPDENSIEIKLHCGVVFKGNIKALLLKQRLHKKCCSVCMKCGTFDKNDLSDYLGKQGSSKIPLYSNYEKINEEYYKSSLEKFGLLDGEMLD